MVPSIRGITNYSDLDLAILVAQSSIYLQDAYRYEKFYDPEDPKVDIIGLQGGRMEVKVDTENPKIDEDIILFNDTMNKDGDLIAQRYRTLKRLLDELGY